LEIKDKFIILRTMKYGEADLILHALSPMGEKLSFIARSALRSKKRFGGGVLEPSHFVQFTYKQAKGSVEGGGLNTLSEATLIEDFRGLRKDYDRLEVALHVLDCVARVSQEGDRNSDAVFNLLGNTLKALETSDNVVLLKMLFYLKFLFQQGVLTVEPWMTPFLKVNMTDINLLSESVGAIRAAQEHLSHIENATQQYIKTAEHH
jgi:DNA repair protein RecO (recombination protein O)